MLKTTLMFISVGAVGATFLGSRFQNHFADSANRKVSDLNVTAGSARNLQVKVPLGTVTLIADGGKDLTVHVIRSYKGPNDDVSRKWMNDSFITAQNRDGQLIVEDHPFGKDSLNNAHLNNVDSSGKNGRSLDLSVQIHLPADLAAKVNVTAGEADLHGRYRSVNAEVSAGTLSTGNLRSSDQVSLSVGAGSLNASLDGRSSGATKIKMGAGEVKLTIPSGAGADVSADVAVGEIVGLPGSDVHQDNGIHLGDRRHGRAGSGNAKVDIHVGTGSVEVQSTDHFLELEVSKKHSVKALSVLDDDEASGMNEIDVDDATQDTDEKNEAIAGVSQDMKIDLDDLKFQDMNNLKELGNLDKDLAKSLKDLGPMIEKAMREAKPDIDKAMREVGPEIERAMKAAQPEIDKAIRESRIEIEKAMKGIKPEVDRAIREAMQELKKALMDLKKSEKVHTH